MGHPDGQNYAIWRGPDFFASASTPISSTSPINAQGLITNFASLVVTLLANPVNGVTVTVTFYTDATATVQTKQYVWNCQLLNVLDVTIPAKGSFVKVSVTTTTVAAGNMPIAIYPTNNIVDHVTYDDVGNSTGGLIVGVPISSTIQFALPNIVAGKGHLFVQDIGSSAKLAWALATVDHNGAVVENILTAPQPFTISQLDFNAPDQPLVLRVTNSDAAAIHNVSAFLSVVDR